MFACSWAGKEVSVAHWPIAHAAKIVGAGILVAGIFDMVENANLIKLLLDQSVPRILNCCIMCSDQVLTCRDRIIVRNLWWYCLVLEFRKRSR